MIDFYHCPRCSRLLKCESVVSFLGDELPVFQCEDCIVKRVIFGPGTDAIELATTFCVDSAGRCCDPTEDLCERNHEPDSDDDTEPDVSLNEPGGVVSSTGSPMVQCVQPAKSSSVKVRLPHGRNTPPSSLAPEEPGQVGVSVIWNTWFDAPVAWKVLPDVVDTVE